MYDPTMLWVAEQRRLTLAAEMRSRGTVPARRSGAARGRWWRPGGPDRRIGV